MTPNNNLSVLPFYRSLAEQNARKWWVYGRVYPLFAPGNALLPFQIIVPHPTSFDEETPVLLRRADGTLVADISEDLATSGCEVKEFANLGYDVIAYSGEANIRPAIPNGQYYLEMQLSGLTLYSEVFTVVNDMRPYLKIEWYDRSDFQMDAGTIVYQLPEWGQIKNVLYLMADVAKPEYVFEEEGETRDGYFFPVKQISEKKYRFSFLASEYLLDVMRFIRMADFVTIRKDGQTYNVDSFLITPKWEDNGDVAAVDAEFETATVAKKIGTGYIRNA